MEVYKNNNINGCAIWVRNIASYIKEIVQAKYIWEQDIQFHIFVHPSIAVCKTKYL